MEYCFSDIPPTIQECMELFSSGRRMRDIWQPIGYYWSCELTEYPRIPYHAREFAVTVYDGKGPGRVVRWTGQDVIDDGRRMKESAVAA